jgi:outer membrane protein OmpA-like peptidoglycan-associated protein
MHTFGQGQKLIKTVYFEYDNYKIDDEEKNKIDSLLLDYKITSINIQGHCDKNGNNSYNDNLSFKRVRAVKEYLLSKEINDSFIHINAFGKRKPINKNRSEDEMAMNRRVEMEVDCINNKQTDILIRGKVLNDLNQPLIAVVSLNDNDGNEVKTVNSDINGNYIIKTKVLINKPYNLVYYSQNNFISTQPVFINDKTKVFRNLTTILPELKKGKKYLFKNMNFFPDTKVLITASKPSIESLLKLMKKNKKLVIRIEGHVDIPLYREDHNDPEVVKYALLLSYERAKMVFDYLISHGIDEKRLSKIGYGAKYMLYPNAVSDVLMEQNRRVEINVVDY